MEMFSELLHNSLNIGLQLKRRGSLLAVFILLIISLFLVELPPWLLDLLLATNILISIVLLLRALFMDSPLAIFSFPTILVLTTLFRLALNVSSTKLILLQREPGIMAAGQVIKAFGNFVVGGDFAVGAIIFAIIAIVNFVVIAKGSARVAEVSARFTLDALPGRQLSLDAELRSGTITKEQAAEKRAELTRESQFFGAMDGAMKWVQGDAIAGLAIAALNAVGGMAIGMSRGLSFADAKDTFGLLAIGDGLVSILPSLLISVSAGIIVTHIAGREQRDSSDEVVTQLIADPRAVVVASLALLLIGFLGLTGVTEFPFFPFFVVSTALLFFAGSKSWSATAGIFAFQRIDAGDVRKLPGSTDGYLQLPPGTAATHKALSSDSLGLDLIRIEVNPSSVRGVTGALDFSGEFAELAERARARVVREYGVFLPELVLHWDNRLAPGVYRVFVREQLTRSGSFPSGCSFAAVNSSQLHLFGIKTVLPSRHPLDHRAGAWFERSQPGLAAIEHLQIKVFGPIEYLVSEGVGAAFSVIDEIFGLAEAKTLLETVKHKHANLITELFDGGRISYPEFAEVLRRLVREHASIRDIKLVLEGIAEFAALGKALEDRQEWLGELHSFLRIVLARTIINQALGPANKLRTFTLSPEIEDEFKSAISMWDYSRTKPPLDPVFETALRNCSTKLFAPVLDRGIVPVVVLCPSEIRAAVQDFFGRQMASASWFQAIAYEELTAGSRPESIGVLTVS